MSFATKGERDWRRMGFGGLKRNTWIQGVGKHRGV